MGLAPLLELDGFIAELGGGYYAKFEAKTVAECEARPAGIKYSLTFHSSDGVRLGGYDNAHPVKEGTGPGRRSGPPNDHTHRRLLTERYPYVDASTLLEDFWTLVGDILKEEGQDS